MKIYEIANPHQADLPPLVFQAFMGLAQAQRGEPELVMAHTQRTVLPGGVMSYAIEHVGDLTNRMARVDLIDWGADAAGEKIEKMYRLLSHGYGFGKEFLENLQGHIQETGENEARYYRRVKFALNKYAEAHEKLPVYNAAQYYAKTAAIYLGQQAFEASRHCLSVLNDWCRKDFESWKAKLLEYKLSPDGLPMQYPYR